MIAKQNEQCTSPEGFNKQRINNKTEKVALCLQEKQSLQWEMGKWLKVAAVIGLIAIARELSKQFGWDKDAALELLGEWSDRLGVWAMPVYVGIHTISLALCLPCAVFFEAGASLLFGFLPAVLCVFFAKVLGASLSFWIGRYFKMSSFVFSFYSIGSQIAFSYVSINWFLY